MSKKQIKKAAIVFPHQLFEKNTLIDKADRIYLVEEHLFFRQYNFHKQKILFHRASMQMYKDFLNQKGANLQYVDAFSPLHDVRNLVRHLIEEGFSEVHFYDPVDFLLMKRIKRESADKISVVVYDSPMFLTSDKEIREYYKDKKRFFQTDFYIWQRKRLHVLVDAANKPEGGKWTFDDENRKRYPKAARPPVVSFPLLNSYYEESLDYITKKFPNNPGEINNSIRYPITFKDSKKWLDHFLNERFEHFGDYEDAIVTEESWLHHSLLTPMLNIGLLTPDYVLKKCLEYAAGNNIPLNSLEGFVRQIIGWREFMRALYILKGVEARTKNYWGFERKLPASFWKGTTGIFPVDSVVRKVNQSAYAHHIERLMVMGNFMLLSEIHPDHVYKWFMELFIDAYDWVMVPNVYSMSQFADGGIMATKPYISGSNYLMKMSDYKKGEWQEIWDALFWRFMHVHREFFESNPRLGMLIRTFDKMDKDKKKALLERAEDYLKKQKE